ncbi:MAG: hypothetical protein ACRDUV_02755 [Pseudonocardiaceae bacterium]
MALTGDWVQQAVAHAASTPGAEGGSTGRSAAWLVVAGSVVHLLFLWAATTISVDKPWGKTRRGRATAADRVGPARRDSRRVVPAAGRTVICVDE